MAATAIKTSMKVLKKVMKEAGLHAEEVAAESVRRKTGHSELWKNLPMTDLARGKKPCIIEGSSMGTKTQPTP